MGVKEFIHIGNSTLSNLIKSVENELGLHSLGFTLTEPKFQSNTLEGFIGYLASASLDNYYLFPAIGDNQIRHELLIDYKERLAPSLISPRAVILEDFRIGSANLIMANSYLGFGVRIGDGNIVLPGVVFSHDIEIGSACFFSPNSTISGFCKIGNRVKIGSGAVVPPNSHVPDDYVLGANEVFNEKL